MEKNYYEILEVDKHASSDIIKKAYTTLAKKYHPDLQTEENKAYATEMIKKLNEAYEILSNDEKRRLYDINLNKNNISIEEYNNLYNQNIELKNQLNNNNNTNNNTNNFAFRTAESFLKSFESKKNVNIQEYEAGQRVYHKKFGEGTINKVEQEGDDLKVDICFDKVGNKRLMAKFAGLQII